MDSNPWLVESIEVFNFFCCPECVYRSQEEFSFQVHALQNHPQSQALFHGFCQKPPTDENRNPEAPASDISTEIKEEPEIKIKEDGESDLNDIKVNDTIIESDKKKSVISEEEQNRISDEKVAEAIRNHNEEYYNKNEESPLESDEDFKEPLKPLSPRKKYACLSCNKEFQKKSLMTKHMNSAHDKYHCDECSKEFLDHKQLIKHKYLHNQVTCEVCQKTISRAVYKRHMRTVHVGKETRTFSCDQCPYTVHAQRYLNEHVKLFHDPSKANREWRPQRKANHENSVLTKKEPSSIKRELTPDEFENCSKCDQKVRSSKIVVHFKRSHGCLPPGYETGSFMCDQCPAELRSKKSLINHLKVIHDESKAGLKYTCHECQLDFSGSRYLICHYKKIHNEIPPDFKDQKQYLCDQCPDVFLTKHSLHLHTLRKHPVGDEPPPPKRVYKKKDKISNCPHCEKTFRCDRNCKEHIKVVHDKSTPFECDQCTRKFGLKRTLLSHKQIVHCKVNCDVCGQEIYNSFELKRHKAAVHGIIPAGAFHCENCPLFFRSEKNLGYHIANKH